jgi:hypothetical protein
VEVDKEVVVAASSEVMGRVLVVLRVMVKLAVMVTRPWPVLYPFIVIVDMAYEPPPPPADAVPIS